MVEMLYQHLLGPALVCGAGAQGEADEFLAGGSSAFVSCHLVVWGFLGICVGNWSCGGSNIEVTGYLGSHLPDFLNFFIAVLSRLSLLRRPPVELLSITLIHTLSHWSTYSPEFWLSALWALFTAQADWKTVVDAYRVSTWVKWELLPAVGSGLGSTLWSLMLSPPSLFW